MGLKVHFGWFVEPFHDVVEPFHDVVEHSAAFAEHISVVRKAFLETDRFFLVACRLRRHKLNSKRWPILKTFRSHSPKTK